MISFYKFFIYKKKTIFTFLIFNHEISAIYLNFSDPWPKKRHELRRLTAKPFLDIYDGYLKDHISVGCATKSKEFSATYLKSRIKNIIGGMQIDAKIDLSACAVRRGHGDPVRQG